VGEVPDQLQTDPVIAVASVMFLIEFVTDKIPLIDSTWDSIHTVVRPAIGGAIGGVYGVDADLSALDEAVAVGGSGFTALVSHTVKAAIRLGVNTSPEPASNIIVSLGEDITVAAVSVLIVENPEVAAAIAAVLLALGLTLVVLIAKRIRRGWRRMQERRRGPPVAG
jgi:Domain of unknown function (DUF4126)